MNSARFVTLAAALAVVAGCSASPPPNQDVATLQTASTTSSVPAVAMPQLDPVSRVRRDRLRDLPQALTTDRGPAEAGRGA